MLGPAGFAEHVGTASVTLEPTAMPSETFCWCYLADIGSGTAGASISEGLFWFVEPVTNCSALPHGLHGIKESRDRLLSLGMPYLPGRSMKEHPAFANPKPASRLTQHYCLTRIRWSVSETRATEGFL